MAKDDYDVIVYKILVYLYGCLKRKTVFNQEVFNKIIKRDSLNDDYLNDVIRMMQQEGFIEGASFTKAWGNVYIMTSDYNDIQITPAGIHYLKENSTAQKIKEILLENADTMAGLIGILAL